MEITFETAHTPQHFEQILQLQHQNLYTSISEEQQVEQGFVFAEHNIELLTQMAAHVPQIIALHNNHIAGYNLAMTPDMKYILPTLIPMFNEFEQTLYQGKRVTDYRYVVGGQVCVSPEFRGQGLLSQLYHETKDRLADQYELCVTEVSARNLKSLKAHQKMGFEIAGTYHDGKELWHVIVWKFSC